MLKMYKIFFILLLPFLLIDNAQAQWIRTGGLEGGNFTQVLFIDSELFAFSRYDLFVSNDGGVSWNWRSTSPTHFGKPFLEGSNIFMLGQGGVRFSSDYGMTWTDKNDGLDTPIVTGAMIRLGNNLFLGGQVQTIRGYSYGALYKSTDNGESWQWCDVPFTEYDWSIDSFFAVDTILIALGQKAIYRSTDRGSSWQMVLNSPPYFSALISRAPIFSIDSIIILGGDNSIFRSSDYGASWQVVADTTGASSFLEYNNTILASTGNKNQAILRSSDLGRSWYSLPFYYDSDIQIRELYQSGAYLFGLNSYYGLFRSNDGGVNWENISKEFPVPYNLELILIQDSLILISNYLSGILRSTDYGTTWKEANSGLTGMPIDYIYAGDNLLLAPIVYPSSYRGKLFRSTDNGNNWGITSSDIQNCKICFLKYKDKLFAGTLWGGVVVSTDDGASWKSNGIPGGLIRSLVAINDSIFAGINGINEHADIGVYVTADQGKTWNAANNGLPYPISVAKIIVVPESIEHGNIIFLATNKGVYHSSDNGNNWLPSNNGIGNENIWTIAAINAPNNSGFNLFAASHNYFFISNDLGESWTSLDYSTNYSSLRLFSYPEIKELNSVLFAKVDTKIFMTSDQGQSWKSIMDNLEAARFYDIDINSDYLYAGTSRGVWKRPLSEIIPVSSTDNVKPVYFALEQNYPNPFNPNTTINYDIINTGLVTIKVYDILGDEIQTLVNEVKSPGTYHVNFDGSNLANGVYFYQLKAGNFFDTKKMVLLR